MQLIIDIPEKIYNYIKRLDWSELEEEEQKHLPIAVVCKAVKESIPLPKGHGRLIDADKTISNICGSSCGCHLEECGYDEPCFSVTRIESAPTIIEADKVESEDKE